MSLRSKHNSPFKSVDGLLTSILIRSFKPLILSILLTLLLFISPTAAASPSWLVEGTRAEYTLTVYRVEFPNRTDVMYSTSTSGQFAWQALAVNSTHAVLNLEVRISSGAAFLHRSGSAMVFQRNVTINLDSRNMYVGTRLIGKTVLWLPTNVSVGDLVEIGGVPPKIYPGQVYSIGYNVGTSQGYQPAFAVDAVCATGESYPCTTPFPGGYFSTRTGLLLGGGAGMDLTSAIALGLSDLDAGLYLSHTTVNLGPSNLLSDFMASLGSIALPLLIGLATGVFIVLRGRR